MLCNLWPLLLELCLPVGALSLLPQPQLPPVFDQILRGYPVPPRNYTTSTLDEPRERLCYTENERSVPANVYNCLPITRKMIRMRRSEQLRLFKGSDCPIVIRDYGTACTVTLQSNSASNEDHFSFRAVALMADWILKTCETPGFGGKAPLGTEGFDVKVDAVLAKIENL